MSVDARSARAALLVVWTVFLAWLWGSGEVTRYVGNRTEWVVPVGALILLVASGLECRRIAREGRDGPRLRLREGIGLGVLLLPILLGAVLANVSLGALAASKKLGVRGVDLANLAKAAAAGADHPSFLQINVAAHNPGFARQYHLTPGAEVSVLGFAEQTPRSAGAPFGLARFYITCCVADAEPLDVRVMPGRAGALVPVRKNAWFQVDGTLARRGRTVYVLRAQHIHAMPEPKEPYLNYQV